MSAEVSRAPSDGATPVAPVVLVPATTVMAGRRALDHAVRLFGSTHRYVVTAVHASGRDRPAAGELADVVVRDAAVSAEPMLLRGVGSRAVCEAVHEVGAVAVVLGIEVSGRDRTAPSFAFRLVHRAPCPVVLVAVDQDESDLGARSDAFERGR